ncbi:hypothetical protein ACJZ2D_003940 [Fusarium nematophilum]
MGLDLPRVWRNTSRLIEKRPSGSVLADTKRGHGAHLLLISTISTGALGYQQAPAPNVHNIGSSSIVAMRFLASGATATSDCMLSTGADCIGNGVKRLNPSRLALDSSGPQPPMLAPVSPSHGSLLAFLHNCSRWASIPRSQGPVGPVRVQTRRTSWALSPQSSAPWSSTQEATDIFRPRLRLASHVVHRNDAMHVPEDEVFDQAAPAPAQYCTFLRLHHILFLHLLASYPVFERPILRIWA